MEINIELVKEVIQRLIDRGEVFAAELACLDYGLNREGFKWQK